VVAATGLEREAGDGTGGVVTAPAPHRSSLPFEFDQQHQSASGSVTLTRRLQEPEKVPSSSLTAEGRMPLAVTASSRSSSDLRATGARSAPARPAPAAT
jgi:hypothetical protein